MTKVILPWKPITDIALLPRKSEFLVWEPSTNTKIQVVYVNNHEGVLSLLYVEELLCDVAPEGAIDATHWCEYPEGPDT